KGGHRSEELHQRISQRRKRRRGTLPPDGFPAPPQPEPGIPRRRARPPQGRAGPQFLRSETVGILATKDRKPAGQRILRAGRRLLRPCHLPEPCPTQRGPFLETARALPSRPLLRTPAVRRPRPPAIPRGGRSR